MQCLSFFQFKLKESSDEQHIGWRIVYLLCIRYSATFNQIFKFYLTSSLKEKQADRQHPRSGEIKHGPWKATVEILKFRQEKEKSLSTLALQSIENKPDRSAIGKTATH